MTDPNETPLEKGKRHVAEAEARIARQKAIVEAMERDKHPDAAERAGRVLVVMEETLRLLRQHVEVMLAWPRLKHIPVTTPPFDAAFVGEGMDSDEHRRRADHYRDLANSMTDEQTRKRLLDLAKKYEVLAGEAETGTSDHPDDISGC
jgi:hypothetical protein